MKKAIIIAQASREATRSLSEPLQPLQSHLPVRMEFWYGAWALIGVHPSFHTYLQDLQIRRLCRCSVRVQYKNRAGVVQWQYRSFPSFGRGFDSHRPLQLLVSLQ